MATPQKICPRCRALAPLDAGFCGQCGHQYRTQFTAPPVVLPQAAPAYASAAFPDPVSAVPRRPLQWLAVAGIAALTFALVFWFAGRRNGAAPSAPSSGYIRQASTPQRVSVPSEEDSAARRALDAEADPVTAQAQREVERAKRDLGLPPPAAAVTPDGRIHLRSGGTIRKEEWDRARSSLESSPLFKEPAVPRL